MTAYTIADVGGERPAVLSAKSRYCRDLVVGEYERFYEQALSGAAVG